MGAHVHASLLQDERLADGVGNLRAAVDEGIGKLGHAVRRNAPAPGIYRAGA